MALVSILVSLNGIFSGNFSLVMATCRVGGCCGRQRLWESYARKTAIRDTKVSNLKTVSEVDVQDFAAQSIQHQVGRMPGESERGNGSADLLVTG